MPEYRDDLEKQKEWKGASIMRIRPYIPDRDYESISKWITDERAHAFWCANLLPYPLTPEAFHDFLKKDSMDWTGSAYVATGDDGCVTGFFCYSVNTDDNIGFLKFIMVDNAKRGKGYGKEMLRLALRYAFQITGARAVQLNVFPENISAKRCYEKVGFAERTVARNAFPYHDESWSRCNMVISKEP